MLEGHTRMFQHVEVHDSARRPDVGVIYNAIPLGDRLRVQFQDVESRSRDCRVIVRFKDPYTSSTFRLIIGAPGPRRMSSPWSRPRSTWVSRWSYG